MAVVAKFFRFIVENLEKGFFYFGQTIRNFITTLWNAFQIH